MKAEQPVEDKLLGGRVRILQPAEGYRAAIDPVLLAAAVPAAAGDRVLDVGAGTGAAALCLAARVSGVRVSGLEIDPGLAALAERSARLGGVAERVTFAAGDLLAPPEGLVAGSFDHVMANPPFIEAGRGRRPADPGKARSTVEGAAGLDDWLGFCLRMVRDKGTVTVVHRADRLDEVLAGLGGGLGGIVVLPLWPGRGMPAKRVVVGGRKGARAPMRLDAGLVLHRPGGGYTVEAEAVLRGAAGLEMRGPRRRRADGG